MRARCSLNHVCSGLGGLGGSGSAVEHRESGSREDVRAPSVESPSRAERRATVPRHARPAPGALRRSRFPQAAARQAAASCANIWQNRTAEIEEYLRTAKVEQVTDIPIGVTRPRRAYLAPGGLGGVVRLEAAAARASRTATSRATSRRSRPTSSISCSALNMVPVVVERRVDNETRRRRDVARGRAIVGIGAAAAEAAHVGFPARADEDVRRFDQQQRSQQGQPARRRRLAHLPDRSLARVRRPT